MPHVIMGTGGPKLTNDMPDAVQIINNSIPNVSVVLVGILMLILILGFFGDTWKVFGIKYHSIIIWTAVLLVLLSFASGAGWLQTYRLPYWLSDPSTQAMLIVILIFGLVVWFITKPDQETQLQQQRRNERNQERQKFMNMIFPGKP
ncbi:MAG: hypothetical protein HC945_02955 [Nitrosarchaeum sp.]|nr:hypothetical protein [Nitrosarchaeum sp.]